MVTLLLVCLKRIEYYKPFSIMDSNTPTAASNDDSVLSTFLTAPQKLHIATFIKTDLFCRNLVLLDCIRLDVCA